MKTICCVFRRMMVSSRITGGVVAGFMLAGVLTLPGCNANTKYYAQNNQHENRNGPTFTTNGVPISIEFTLDQSFTGDLSILRFPGAAQQTNDDETDENGGNNSNADVQTVKLRLMMLPRRDQGHDQQLHPGTQPNERFKITFDKSGTDTVELCRDADYPMQLKFSITVEEKDGSRPTPGYYYLVARSIPKDAGAVAGNEETIETWRVAVFEYQPQTSP